MAGVDSQAAQEGVGKRAIHCLHSICVAGHTVDDIAGMCMSTYLLGGLGGCCVQPEGRE